VTRIGKLELRVPRDRNGEFSTALFERYGRSLRPQLLCFGNLEDGVIRSMAVQIAIGINWEGQRQVLAAIGRVGGSGKAAKRNQPGT
jgi:transposase-like protein